jgi:xanthine dehydrogenase accessory factor
MSLYETLARLERAGQAAAVCTVIRVQGSVPRGVGAKLVVPAEGEPSGTIGGGEMEARVVAAARQVITSGDARVVTHQLADPASGDPGVCGGTVEVLIEPIGAVTQVLVIGGGHVGRAVVHLADWLGMRVILADDRPEFATPESAPGADAYLTGAVNDWIEAVAFTPRTYVLLLTRGVPVDLELLPVLLARPHAYIGVIGSRRRWLTARQALAERGVAAEVLDRVRDARGDCCQHPG